MCLSHIQRLAAVIVLGGLASSPRAEARPPQTYSYVQDPAAGVMGAMVVKVVRDGPLEAIDQFLPVGPDRTKELHSRVLYDFRAHKIYSEVVSDLSVPCTVMSYTSPAAPEELDVITGSADSMRAFLARARPLWKEKVNGIPARVVEVKEGQARLTGWVADPGGFLVKVIMNPAGGGSITVLEVKRLSFAKPPASALTRPHGCKAVAGEATATGGHAEFGSEASASEPGTTVIAVTLRSVPDYSGPCPAHIRLTGTVTADGPGRVFYQFGAGTMEPGETITFSAPGSKTVSRVITFGADSGPGTHIGVSAMVQAVGEDASGNHDGLVRSSSNAEFMISCTAAAPAVAPGAEAGAPAPAPAAGPRMTAVGLSVTPTRYSGACPVQVKLVGTLKADGPGTAYFQFQAGALGVNGEGTVQVGADGTATVTSDALVGRTPEVQSVRFLGGMEPRGHQENAQWSDVELDLHCTDAP